MLKYLIDTVLIDWVEIMFDMKSLAGGPERSMEAMERGATHTSSDHRGEHSCQVFGQV